MKSTIGSLLFVVVIGLLPLWFTIYVVVAGGQGSHNSEYWAVAPWGLFFGAAYCAFTLPVAVLPVLVYHQTAGDARRKFRFAAASFAIGIAIMASVIGGLVHHKRQRKATVAQEKAAIAEFVRNDPRVRRAFADDYDVASPECAMDRHDNLVWCDVGVQPAGATFEERFRRQIYAVVDVAHPDGTLALSLRCVTPLRWTERDDRNSCDGATPVD